MDTEIKFRVDQEDKARFEEAAKAERRSLSGWVRLACLDALGDVLVEVNPDRAPTIVKPFSGNLDALGAKKNPVKRTAKPKMRTLTPEEREAKIAAAQSWLPKGKR